MKVTRLLTTLALFFAPAGWGNDVYQAPDAFLNEVFESRVPQPQVIWLTGERGATVAGILGHKAESLRIRYWKLDDRTAWILNEIGKERPITVGFVVGPEGIQTTRILIYRENRGAEVRFPFFTDQFLGANLIENQQLNRGIDNITGATLSVSAVKRLARVALFLHSEVTR